MKTVFPIIIITLLTISSCDSRNRCYNRQFKFECNILGEIGCISKRKLCDGVVDCPDNGEDEDPKLCSKRVCNSDSIRCAKSRKCIKKDWTCDGWEDCGEGDNSDEANCNFDNATETADFERIAEPRNKTYKVRFCPEDTFQCNDGKKCLAMEEVCDGKPQCHDNSDEFGCEEACQKLTCSYKCQQYPNGPKCSCMKNFAPRRLNDTFSKCFFDQKLQDNCDHDKCPINTCVNKRDSFKCQCEQGFNLSFIEGVGTVCKDETFKIMGYIIGNGPNLSIIMDNKSSLIKITGNLVNFFFEPLENLIFYILSGDQTIYMLKYPDTKFKPINAIKGPSNDMTSISMDNVDKNFYLSTSSDLMICHLNVGKNLLEYCKVFYQARNNERIQTAKLNRRQNFYVAAILNAKDKKLTLYQFDLIGNFLRRIYLTEGEIWKWNPTLILDPHSQRVSIYPKRHSRKIYVVDFQKLQADKNSNKFRTISLLGGLKDGNPIGMTFNPLSSVYVFAEIENLHRGYFGVFEANLGKRCVSFKEKAAQKTELELDEHSFDRSGCIEAPWYPDEEDGKEWMLEMIYSIELPSNATAKTPCDGKTTCSSRLWSTMKEKCFCVANDVLESNAQKIHNNDVATNVPGASQSKSISVKGYSAGTKVALWLLGSALFMVVIGMSVLVVKRYVQKRQLEEAIAHVRMKMTDIQQ